MLLSSIFGNEVLKDVQVWVCYISVTFFIDEVKKYVWFNFVSCKAEGTVTFKKSIKGLNLKEIATSSVIFRKFPKNWKKGETSLDGGIFCNQK